MIRKHYMKTALSLIAVLSCTTACGNSLHRRVDAIGHGKVDGATARSKGFEFQRKNLRR